ncbi:MAG: hypothetical protein J0H12_04905 [Candidatus Paracaedimonas acanthamoebae]|uniref:Uncharacterized protein n=1 Tax=Candidatus Paracaedimonas acanthamoebae TaxID=244581 RepID=A0A8J7TTU2_9PROT|nr:hypothetical protein [Candidatus Paracaedimonas acanthamoebae]
MFRILTSTTLSASLLFGFSVNAATADTKTAAPEVLAQSYRCPPFENTAQCKKAVEDKYIKCMGLVDQEEQDDEDSHGDRAPLHPTQRVCAVERDKGMAECESNCK